MFRRKKGASTAGCCNDASTALAQHTSSKLTMRFPGRGLVRISTASVIFSSVVLVSISSASGSVRGKGQQVGQCQKDVRISISVRVPPGGNVTRKKNIWQSASPKMRRRIGFSTRERRGGGCISFIENTARRHGWVK